MLHFCMYSEFQENLRWWVGDIFQNFVTNLENKTSQIQENAGQLPQNMTKLNKMQNANKMQIKCKKYRK